MKKLMLFVSAVVLLFGCASTRVMVPDPDGGNLWADGDVAQVTVRAVTTITQNPDGTSSVVATEETYKNAETNSSAKLKVKLAEIEKDRAVGIAKANRSVVSHSQGGYGGGYGYIFGGNVGGTTFRSGRSWQDSSGAWHVEGGSARFRR